MSNTKDLLFELGCEELPTTTLKTLRDHLLNGICSGLDEANLSFGTTLAFATPRRLAVWIEGIETSQADELVEKRGPAVAAAYDKDGNPSKAALGFARGCGAEFDELETLKTDKGEWLSYKKLEKGQPSESLLPAIIEKSLSRLPIAKRMRWGSSNDAFVRPVHWVVLLFGSDVIESQFFGLNASNTSFGHRFHAPGKITISSAADYSRLLSNARVIASFEERKSLIEKQAIDAAQAVNGTAHIDPSLLDEIAALVEYPVAVTGGFDEHFLALPKEILITTMQINQKYFPVLNDNGTLLPFFITISNIKSSNPASVSHGNERVISPRLSDAEFFWQQDMKNTLAERIPTLDNVVFQHKLGSIGDKTRRVDKLSCELAALLGHDVELASRAAQLSKTDLVTDMVGEFASLQGVIGRYYASENGEPEEVAAAIQEQYLPKQSGGALPTTKTGQILALSDKLDTLVGIFSIGLLPTGDKDPFALRRAALGILRILIEHDIKFDLNELVRLSCQQFRHGFDADGTIEQVVSFVLDRLKGYCLANNFSPEQFAAVKSVNCTAPVDFMSRLHAVKAFSLLNEAASLSETNKRIQNLLKKAPNNIAEQFDAAILSKSQEVALYKKLQLVEGEISPLIEQNQYIDALKALSNLKEPIDEFFEHIFIMADDEAVKNTRLALLSKIHANFIKIADISLI
ncbi:MAG: glycine--tRNA ligase subunit beta [Cycloclasticus sp. symbiont of Poecilosclerida sp. M]|nr:MAG: glycine--tRNA ligase subunit beta [Cycloclasticus sp. symbiont of Poecilosclerida sp. M]